MKCKHRNLIGEKTIYLIERPGQMYVEHEQSRVSVRCKDCGKYIHKPITRDMVDTFELTSQVESLKYMI